MAYVINPDGTVSTIETTYDQYGNLKPKIDSEVLKEQEIHYSKNTISKSNEKGYVYHKSTVSRKYKNKEIIRKSISVPNKQAFIGAIMEGDPFEFHFSLGMWIRNNWIYEQEEADVICIEGSGTVVHGKKWGSAEPRNLKC